MINKSKNNIFHKNDRTEWSQKIGYMMDTMVHVLLFFCHSIFPPLDFLLLSVSRSRLFILNLMYAIQQFVEFIHEWLYIYEYEKSVGNPFLHIYAPTHPRRIYILVGTDIIRKRKNLYGWTKKYMFHTILMTDKWYMHLYTFKPTYRRTRTFVRRPFNKAHTD